MSSVPTLFMYDEGKRDVTEVTSMLEWDYLSDVLVLGETSHFKVANAKLPDGGWLFDKLQIGRRVRFALQNPEVNGGAPTTKARGHLVELEDDVSADGGEVATLTVVDAGWHINNSDAPLWLPLLGQPWDRILNPKGPLLDPSWMLGESLKEGKTRGQQKLGRVREGASFYAQLAFQGPDAITYVQVEPEQTVADVLMPYAAREGLLVNLTPDQRLCLFRPNDRTAPLYSIALRRETSGLDPSSPSQSNVLRSQRRESADTRWTEVTVVGDVTPDDADHSIDPNRGHLRERITRPGSLPFMHRRTAADGDRRSEAKARAQADWIADRGLFDSWSIDYTVPEHYQDGEWFESDQTVSVHDDIRNLHAILYVSAAHCFGSKTEGDYTVLTVRKPGLLSGGVPQ